MAPHPTLQPPSLPLPTSPPLPVAGAPASTASPIPQGSSIGGGGGGGGGLRGDSLDSIDFSFGHSFTGMMALSFDEAMRTMLLKEGQYVTCIVVSEGQFKRCSDLSANAPSIFRSISSPH